MVFDSVVRAGKGRVVASHSAGEDYLVGMDVDGGFLLGKGDLEFFIVAPSYRVLR